MLLNGYVLDAVPLDANAIYKGAASSGIPLAETATSFKYVHPAASTGSVPLGEAVNGLIARLGAGSTPVTMTYYAVAYKRAMAQAIGAIGLSETAVGNGIAAHGSMLYVRLSETADGRNALQPHSTAEILLGQVAKPARVALGMTLVEVIMAGRAGIPDPVIIRPGITDAHPSRWMRVGSSNRTMTVQPERPSVVSRQDRTMRIDADDRSV